LTPASDTSHPVLQPVLLSGYDFTRNQPGASEWLDIPQLQKSSSGGQSPVIVRTIQRCDP